MNKTMPKTVLILWLSMASLWTVELFQDGALRWGFREVEGATGSFGRGSEMGYVLQKTNAAGHLFLLNETSVTLQPGRHYRVRLVFKVDSLQARGGLMLSMPGGKRTPFPVSELISPTKESGEVALVFTARPDERALRIHFVFKGIGRATVERIAMEEMTEAELAAENSKDTLTALECGPVELKRFWKPLAQRAFTAGDSGLEAEVMPGGGFACALVDWPAAGVKAIEVRFKAHDEGGYLQLDFEAEAEGRKFSGFQTRSLLPDGEWHSVIFPVGEDPSWQGRIRSMKLSWKSTFLPCRVALARLRALPFPNLIPDAERLAANTATKLDGIKPRGQYRLSWRDGANPGLKLTFVDRMDRVLSQVELPAGKESVDFNAPGFSVYGNLVLGGKSAGFPLLELHEIPALDPAASSWQGAWIWSRFGSGPNETTVWFKRVFNCPAVPAEATVLATGDDQCSLFVNGREFPITSDWTQPGRLSIARELKAGRNELLLKVRNAGAWGGALLNLYVRNPDGSGFFISTDERWTCREGGETPPAKVEDKVVLHGKYPCPPWGSRVAYSYLGPLGKLRISTASAPPGTFKAEVLTAPPVSTERLDVAVKFPDGTVKRMQAAIEPPTGLWKAGTSLSVRYALPQLTAEKGGPALVDLETGFLETEGPARLGTVDVKAKENRPLTSFSISGAGERPWFRIQGERLPPFYYDLPGAFIDSPEGRGHLIRNMAKAGIPIVRLPLFLSKLWPEPGRMDFSALDRAMEVIAQSGAGTRVLLATATYMPAWWLAQNPGEATAFFGGEKPNPTEDFQSLASKKWLADLDILLARLIEHIRKSSYADRIVGIAPVDGVTWENMWSHGRGHPGRAYADASPAAQRAFRSFLEKRYGGDARLAAAWAKPGLTLDAARQPEPSRLDGASVANLLDPQRDRDLIDYFTWRNEQVADYLCAGTSMVKRGSGGAFLSGSYYGYLLMFSRMYWHLQDGGHLRLSRLARHPDLDFVYGPTLYHWRRLGLGDSPMQPAEAFSSHGKLVITELDLRTFSEPTHYESVNGKTDTPEQTLGALDRAFALCWARGMGGHWMEMYERWFREPLILDALSNQYALYRSLPEKPLGLVPREVCIVSDEDSAFYVKNNAGDGIHNLLTAELMRRLPEAGFSFRHVLLADLLEPGRVPPQKLYIANNTLVLGEEARRVLMERFRKENAQVLWLYAPGVFYPDRGPSPGNIEALLGIPFSMDTEKKPLSMRFKGGAFGDGLVESMISTGPWFFPISGFDEVLAQTPEGKPALVRWRKGGLTQYFATVPNLPPGALRAIAAGAGVHSYFIGEDPVHAGNDLVALHAKTGGRKTLALPPGLRARAVLGPWAGTLNGGGAFTAVAGRTYGFLIEKE